MATLECGDGVVDEFSYNGVRLDDDYRAHRENRRIDGELCLVSLFGFHGSLASIALLDAYFPGLAEGPSFRIGLVFSALIFLTSSLVGFSIEEKKRRAPQVDGDSAHITGFGAFVGLCLLVVILSAAWLGQANYGHFVVPETFGIAAIALLIAGFVLVALLPRVVDASTVAAITKGLRLISAPLSPLGRIMSAVDAWLVYCVAPTVGCTLRETFWRYSVLTLNLMLATVIAWFCPAPYGGIGTLWAIIASIGVARRWAWSETERARLMSEPKLDQSQLRVTTTMDLRDEALWSLILLVVVIPIGIRQFYMTAATPAAFLLNGPVRDDPTAWMGLFGVELLKALPFVDWADIYGAQGATRISAHSALALHAIFAARVLIDLVFIGALVQSISISVALSRHKRQFLARRVNVLDDRIEKSEISRLARRKRGRWQYRPEIDAFRHYDTSRLSRLRLNAKKGSRLHAALVRLFELEGHRYAPPGEQFVELARDKKVNRKALEAGLQRIKEEQHFDIDYLADARRALNWKGGIDEVRQEVVRLITTQPWSLERNSALIETLRGKLADGLAPLRMAAADCLIGLAAHDSAILGALHEAALNDRSNVVRRRIITSLKTRNLPLPLPNQQKSAA